MQIVRAVKTENVVRYHLKLWIYELRSKTVNDATTSSFNVLEQPLCQIYLMKRKVQFNKLKNSLKLNNV